MQYFPITFLQRYNHEQVVSANNEWCNNLLYFYEWL